jgi:hypothetical protein
MLLIEESRLAWSFLDTPGCNGFLFRYGACPSERGAAGTTPQEVKQSALWAIGILAATSGLGSWRGCSADRGCSAAASGTCQAGLGLPGRGMIFGLWA